MKNVEEQEVLKEKKTLHEKDLLHTGFRNTVGNIWSYYSVIGRNAVFYVHFNISTQEVVSDLIITGDTYTEQEISKIVSAQKRVIELLKLKGVNAPFIERF